MLQPRSFGTGKPFTYGGFVPSRSIGSMVYPDLTRQSCRVDAGVNQAAMKKAGLFSTMVFWQVLA
jgi:hypothetical protein